MRALISLLPHFRKDAGYILLGLLVAALAMLAALLLSALSGLTLAEGVTPEWLLGSTALILLLRAAGLSRLVLRYIERLVLHGATFRTLARIRLWFFNAVTPLAPAGLGLMRGGELLSRLMNDVGALDGLILRLVAPVCMLAFGLIVTALVMAYFSALAAGLVITILLIGILASLWLSRAGRQAAQHAITAQGELRAHTMDGLTGMAELMAFGRGGHQGEILVDHAARLAAHQLAERRAVARGALGVQLALGMAVAALLWLPLGLATLPLLFVLLGLGEWLLAVPALAQQGGRMNEAAARLQAVARQPAPVPEPVSPQPLPNDLTITLADVALTYAGRTVLNNINFTLAAGERVMLTGPSGSGKSSLVNLLLRFVAPTAGMIRLGGVDVTHLRNNDVRRCLGVLSQRTRLVSGTVRENLLLANPTADDTALWAALESAALTDVVKALPQGLETWVGENGLQLSGGQARRLALAQMLLKDAPIWLLDEPTEGLDESAARALLETLRQLGQGRTILLITHQPALGAALEITRHWRLEAGILTL